MFIDRAIIKVSAGNGGSGAVAFHREKYVASGGPDGGDGGKGGDVIFVIDDGADTLSDFRYKRKYAAENGTPGGARRARRLGQHAFCHPDPPDSAVCQARYAGRDL